MRGFAHPASHHGDARPGSRRARRAGRPLAARHVQACCAGFFFVSPLDWRRTIGVAQSIIANSRRWGMAEADLDVLIRSIARKKNKDLMDAAKKRQSRYMAMAAKATNKETKQRYKLIAKNTILYATAAAKRLQISADNAADSYARSMKKAAEQAPEKPTNSEKPAKKAKKKA
jgi:hypothetical protein